LTGRPAAPQNPGVQTHGEDLVELTIILDSSDYRKMNVAAGRRWLGSSIYLVSALGAIVTALACQWLGAALLAIVALLVVVGGTVVRAHEIRKLPDWAFAPFTYRLTLDTITVITPVGRRETIWTALPRRRKLPHIYLFTGAAGQGVAIVRRTLTQQDEAALDALLARII
jgi:hypothetical protein